MYQYIIDHAVQSEPISRHKMLEHLGLKVELIGETKLSEGPEDFSDDTKTAAFLKQALQQAHQCPECGGYLDGKSVSYDHGVDKKHGGKGVIENCKVVHPYCNSAKDILKAVS